MLQVLPGPVLQQLLLPLLPGFASLSQIPPALFQMGFASPARIFKRIILVNAVQRMLHPHSVAAAAQHQVLLAKFWGGLTMTSTLKLIRNHYQKKGKKKKSHTDSSVVHFVSGSSILELLPQELPPNYQNFLS